MTHLLTIRKIQHKGPKRGPRMVHGRVESRWLVKLENDIPAKPWRRVYEDWNAYVKGEDVPLVLVIGTAIITLDATQRDQLEAHGCVPCAHIADYYDQAQRRRKSIGNNLLRRGYREWATGEARDPYINNLYGDDVWRAMQ